MKKPRIRQGLEKRSWKFPLGLDLIRARSDLRRQLACQGER
jgi:hypothetical protein